MSADGFSPLSEKVILHDVCAVMRYASKMSPGPPGTNWLTWPLSCTWVPGSYDPPKLAVFGVLFGSLSVMTVGPVPPPPPLPPPPPPPPLQAADNITSAVANTCIRASNCFMTCSLRNSRNASAGCRDSARLRPDHKEQRHARRIRIRRDSKSERVCRGTARGNGMKTKDDRSLRAHGAPASRPTAPRASSAWI